MIVTETMILKETYSLMYLFQYVVFLITCFVIYGIILEIHIQRRIYYLKQRIRDYKKNESQEKTNRFEEEKGQVKEDEYLKEAMELLRRKG